MVGQEFDACNAESSWFAVWTRSRQEKVAASILESLGVPNFLPLRSEVRRWSDRNQAVTFPLFPGYLFVRISLATDARLRVLNTAGIADFVRNSKGPAPIPDQQIEDIRTVLTQGIKCDLMPHLEAGEPVRVVRGPLAGIEGKLIRVNSMTRLVISVETIQKSITVSVMRQDVESLNQNAA